MLVGLGDQVILGPGYILIILPQKKKKNFAVKHKIIVINHDDIFGPYSPPHTIYLIGLIRHV